jgi:hypothetical protein
MALSRVSMVVKERDRKQSKISSGVYQCRFKRDNNLLQEDYVRAVFLENND